MSDELPRTPATQYGASIGPKQSISDLVGTGPRIRSVRGTADTFISQQSGMIDRYFRPGDDGRDNIYEFLPIDSSKFVHNKVDQNIWYDIHDMPWYVSGYTKKFDDHEMMQAIFNILDPAVDKLVEASSVTQMSSSQHIIYGKREWDRVLADVREMVEIAVSSERPQGTSAHLSALTMSANNNSTMKIFPNKIWFDDDKLEAKLSIPEMENRELVNWKRFGGWFDVKVKMLCAWLCYRMFGSSANGMDIQRMAITLRLLGTESVDQLISKMAIGLVPKFDERTCAVLAVFQEALGLLFSQNSELVPLNSGTSKLRLFTNSVGEVSRASKSDYMARYFGGNVDMGGSGNQSHAWLIDGQRGLLDGSQLMDYAFIPLEGVDTDLGVVGKKVKDDFHLNELITRSPFLVGPPTTERGNLIHYTDAEDAPTYDGFPFRTEILGGLITSLQRSYFDQRPSTKTIVIPKVVTNPRFDFSAAGFVEALKSGNISTLKGDTCVPTGTWSLTGEGRWVR